MSRTYDAREFAERITQFLLFRVPTSGGYSSNIATTAVVEADTALTVASITGAANLDNILLLGQQGDADLVKISGTPASGSLPLGYQAAIPAAIGSKVVKLTSTDLGDFKGGLNLTGSSQLSVITGSISRATLGSFAGPGARMGGSAALYGFNGETLQTAFGAPEKVIGTGAPTTPRRSMIRGSKIGTEGLAVVRGIGLMNDNQTVFWLDWLNAKFSAQINTNLGGGQEIASLNAQWDATCLGLTVFD